MTSEQQTPLDGNGYLVLEGALKVELSPDVSYENGCYYMERFLDIHGS